ncbi:MAG: thioesterase family protein, partial [Polyangiaceae bacterium]
MNGLMLANMVLDASFYEVEGSGYRATPSTAGPWDPKLQHGGPLAALLATRIERAAARADSRISHFALEFLAAVPVASLDVTTEQVRPGKKISLWSARAAVGGRDAVRATAWLLATSEGRNPSVHLDDDALPPMPDAAIDSFFEAIPHFGQGDALEWRVTEGSFSGLGPMTVWARMRIPLVAGEVISPIARVLTMVDSANGASAELSFDDYLFVPVNLTVSLARHPATEWVGMRAVSSLASDGVGVTRAHLFDERGMIGEALQTLYVEKRAR